MPMNDAVPLERNHAVPSHTPVVQPILACQRCRKRKAGCDRQLPTCSRCAATGQSCEYESHPKRKRKSPTGPKQLRTIEDRVASIEACLKSSGILNRGGALSTNIDDIATPTDADYVQSGDPLPESELPRSLLARASEPRSQDAAVERISKSSSPEHVERNVVNSACGSALQQDTTSNALQEPHRYWPRIAERLGGPLADLLFPRGVYCVTRLGEPVLDFRSPQGLRWLSEKSNPTCAREIVQTLISCTGHEKEGTSLFANISTNAPSPIPPESETLNVLNTYFKYCNPTYPLFEEANFRSLVQEQFHGRPPPGTAWYACFNVALCLGMRALDAMGLRGIEMAKHRRPRDYFENAMRHSSELLMETPSILGVGALVGLAIYIQTTEDVDPSFSLLSIALRQVRQLYLTTKSLPTTPSQSRDCKQIRRLFWLAYSINNDTILQSGCPWVPADSEVDFEFAQGDLVDENSIDGERPNIAKYEVFFARVKLALIQSMIYRELYMTTARQRPLSEIARRIQGFEHELREWETTILESVRPPGSIMLQPALLGLRYHSTILMVHHLSTMVAYNSLDQRNEYTADAATQSSVKACVEAARATIGVLRALPNRTCKYALNQLVMKSALASFATLFSNVLASPEDVATSNDIDLMNFVVEIIHSFKQNGSYAKVAAQLLCASEVMTRVARQVVRARRRRRPMLDYPSTSLLTVSGDSGAPSSLDFDWDTITSEPSTMTLESFLSMAPSAAGKPSPNVHLENSNAQNFHSNAVDPHSKSLFVESGMPHVSELPPNVMSSWPFSTSSQEPVIESQVDSLENMDLRFPLQDFQYSC